MIIDLEPPFSNNWRKGYLSKTNEGRQIIALYNAANDRKTISYARYLKSVELGYEIPEGFEVDHIDDDKTNDTLCNLQILTRQQNIDKDNKIRVSKYKGCQLLCCCNCGIIYTLTAKQERLKALNRTKLNFCSKSCSGKYYYKNNEPPIKKIDISVFENEVRKLRKQGLSERRIHQTTGLSRHSLRLVK